MSNRVLALVKKMFNFALDREWIDANPAARLKPVSPESARDRVLSRRRFESSGASSVLSITALRRSFARYYLEATLINKPTATGTVVPFRR